MLFGFVCWGWGGAEFLILLLPGNGAPPDDESQTRERQPGQDAGRTLRYVSNIDGREPNLCAAINRVLAELSAIKTVYLEADKVRVLLGEPNSNTLKTLVCRGAMGG